MKPTALFLSAAFLLASVTSHAKADTFQLTFSGSGVSGSATVTYGTATDGKYSQALEVTGISGTFSDSNVGITNATITGLLPLNLATPEPTNFAAPSDFSKFAVATGLPDYANGVLTYDNLFWPGGSPQTGSDYPFFGGYLDVYGLLFSLDNGTTVDFWSNGILTDGAAPDYGAAVVTSQAALDYVGNGVAVTPEPSSLWLLATGALALLWWRPAFLRPQA